MNDNVVYKYYENGNLRSKTSIDINSKRINGEHWQFYDNGGIELYCMRKNGLLHGNYKDYYPNGKERVICNYIENKLHGKFYLFNEEGEKIKVLNFNQGELEGLYENYDTIGLKRLRKYQSNEKILDLNFSKLSEIDRQDLFSSLCNKKGKFDLS